MFHWICPECGREIPPAVRECPACDPKAALVLKPIPEPALPVEALAPELPAVEQANPVEQPAAPQAIPVETAEPLSEPDPLLALAEQIRSAQTSHAKPADEPPSQAPGLAELAAVVGTSEPVPVEAPSEPAFESEAAATPAAPARSVTTQPLALTQGTQAVALLAPPEVVVAPLESPIAPALAAVEAPAEPVTIETPRPSEPEPEPLSQAVAPEARAIETVESKAPPVEAQASRETPAAAAPAVESVATPEVEVQPAELEPVVHTGQIRTLAQSIEAEAISEAQIQSTEPAPVAQTETLAQAVESEATSEIQVAQSETAPLIEAEAAPEAQVQSAEPTTQTGIIAPSVEAEATPEVQVQQAEPLAQFETLAPPIEAEATPEVQIQSAEPNQAAQSETPAAPVETEDAPEVHLQAAEPVARVVEAETPATPIETESTPEIQVQQSEPEPAAQAVEALERLAEAVAPPAPIETALSELEKPLPAAPPVEAQAPDAPPLDVPQPPVLKALPDAAALSNPPSGSRLQLAPLQNYPATAAAVVRPAAPPAQILTPDSGPRMTLPGPTLPPELVALKSPGVVTVLRGSGSKRRLPGWLISALLMLGIPLAGGLLLLYFQPLQHSSADASPVPEVQVPAVAASDTSRALAQLVEVTGFRIVVDFNKKSEIHYLVVNHSAADLSDMTLFVTLRSAGAKPGQPPVARFSFRAPGLGPFESKEMSSPIEKPTRSVTLPEWQDLRAEVQVGQ